MWSAGDRRGRGGERCIGQQRTARRCGGGLPARRAPGRREAPSPRGGHHADARHRPTTRAASRSAAVDRRVAARRLHPVPGTGRTRQMVVAEGEPSEIADARQLRRTSPVSHPLSLSLRPKRLGEHACPVCPPPVVNAAMRAGTLACQMGVPPLCMPARHAAPACAVRCPTSVRRRTGPDRGTPGRLPAPQPLRPAPARPPR